MKAWNEMDIKEQKEVFARFLASEIAKSLESGLEFKPNNRAYNGNAGNAYNGLNSLILDAKQHENGYESNVWVGLDDALKLGANPKEVEHIKNNTKSKNNPNGFYDKASIAYIRDYEMRYVKARDEQGNLIPLKDKEGNLKHYSNGEVIYENEKVPQRDKEGNIKYMQDGKTPFYEFKKEKIDIEPTLEIKNLYNVNVFQTLDKTKLKELDPKTLRTQYISNTFSMNIHNIHCYKFNEAVSDKVVLDLNYEARSVDQYVSSPEKLDEYFELKTQNLNETAKTELKKKWVNLQKVFSTKDRLARIVQDIVLDMAKLPRLRSEKGNAMLVAESVYNACRYFELFLETELKDKVAVITSYEPNIADLKDCGSDESEESYKYRAYCKMLQNFFNEKDEKKALNKIKEFEEKVKERFINEPNRMKLLIVVDKLLTGFDAPSLTYLYMDKKMQDHGLFQAVCRVNRLDSEDKDFGCIIDYKDLFESLEKAHSDYTNKAFENYEREDIQGFISDKAQKIKKKLEEARDQLKSLCESVKEPKDEMDYTAYFCGSDLEKNAQKRRLFYQLVGVFLRMFVELNNLEKPIYSKEEMRQIKQEAEFYRHLQKVIGLSSGDSVDLKSYSEEMRRILDAYIKATDSETLIKIEDQGLCEVLAQMNVNDFNKALSQVFKNESSMAESIANNTRKRIIEKEASDPKYYEKLSSLLNDLILQFREKKLTYLEYLQQIHDLAKKVIDKEDRNYPKKINTNALKTLYDNLDENEALALETDACIRGNKKDGWVGHNQKEKNLKIALRKIIDDEVLLESTFNLAKHIEEYH
ncbi:type I restriction enzyme subunit R domain-containing protein [Helicobacter pylori]|uniref:type I restriction enzyme subunit R domain-containing protein n=3 Tax=Helicobacter pylori TaxID=210 RepID=UPI000EB1099B|nr:ArdC-like ssDNA-binding domain-containing protein [Helicobacter pylori]